MVNLLHNLLGSKIGSLVKQADPAQALNVPVVPLGAMLAAAYPLSSRPPYVLSRLNTLISADGMMDPELLKKLVMSNFCEYFCLSVMKENA